MLIILEGVDRTGKSTLATALAEFIGGEVWHRGKPSAHPLVEYEGALRGYDPLDYTRHVVIDRWHVGERVWPSVFNRATRYDLPMFLHTDMFLRSRGALVVYCYRPDSDALAREYREHGEPLEPATLTRALSLYDAALGQTHAATLRWSFEVSSSPSLEFIVSSAKHRQDQVKRLHRITSEWVGSPYPEALLVGDELGPGYDPVADAAVPFVPYATTSGHYLLSAAPRLACHGLVTNAHSASGSDHLEPLYSKLGQPPVVALGKRASRTLMKLGIPHCETYHPQYWRRFRHHEPHVYAELVTNAVKLARGELTCT